MQTLWIRRIKFSKKYNSSKAFSAAEFLRQRNTILKKDYLVYFMTLTTDKKHPMLVMINEAGVEYFVFRPFYVRASSRKTFHEGLEDQKCNYQVV